MSLKAVETKEIPNIEIEYRHFNTHAAFRQALMRVVRNNTLPMKTAYWLGRIHKELDKNLSRIGLEYQALITEYAEKDADGKPLPGDRPGSIKLSKEKEAEFEQKQKAFDDQILKLPFPKLRAGDFERAALTAEDIQALEPLMWGLE